MALYEPTITAKGVNGFLLPHQKKLYLFLIALLILYDLIPIFIYQSFSGEDSASNIYFILKILIAIGMYIFLQRGYIKLGIVLLLVFALAPFYQIISKVMFYSLFPMESMIYWVTNSVGIEVLEASYQAIWLPLILIVSGVYTFSTYRILKSWRLQARNTTQAQ